MMKVRDGHGNHQLSIWSIVIKIYSSCLRYAVTCANCLPTDLEARSLQDKYFVGKTAHEAHVQN